MPLEQPIIEHDHSLIGESVHYYNPEFVKHTQPRTGKIIGFGAKPGLFNVIVFMDHDLDIKRGRPAIRHATSVLLVANAGDSPIGLRDVAVLMNVPVPTSTVEIEPAKDEKPSVKPETSPPDSPQGTGGGGSEDSPADPGAGDPETAPAATELIEEEVHKKPAADPIDVLLITGPWKLGADEKVIRTTKINSTTLAIYLAAHPGEDRPFAKITYQHADDATRGYTLKVRDKAGRASIVVDSVLRTTDRAAAEEKMRVFVQILMKLANLASMANMDDHGSQFANMDQAIQEHRKGK